MCGGGVGGNHYYTLNMLLCHLVMFYGNYEVLQEHTCLYSIHVSHSFLTIEKIVTGLELYRLLISDISRADICKLNLARSL